MVWKKILLFSIVLLTLISGVNAIIYDDFETGLIDSGLWSSNGPSSISTYTNIDTYSVFTPSSKSISSINLSGTIGTSGKYVLQYYVTMNTSGFEFQPTLRNTAGSNCFFLNSNFPNANNWGYYVGAWINTGISSTSGNAILYGDYLKIKYLINNDDNKISVRFGNSSTDDISPKTPLCTVQEFNAFYIANPGYLDNVSVWNFTTYGWEQPLTPTPTPTINHNVSTYYNSNNISIGLNTSTNVNMSYFLDSGIKTSICNDCNLSTLNLNNLGDSIYNIIFTADGETGQTNTSTINFTIDTIIPVIINSINSTITDYLFNANFSCTDTNLDSCNISINGFNKVNNSIFTLNNNGNLSYNLTASDLAGNTASTNGTIFINPFQIFKFNDTTLNLLVSSFTFGGLSSSGNQVKIPTYNSVLSLGSNVLEFVKFGYNIQNFTININTTSDINQTYNITPTTLVIKVFDSTSITTQLTFNITIINSTDSQVFTNQLNFSKRFNETLGGAISLVIESDGYSTGYFFNTLNQDTTLNINSYLTPINQSSTIRFFVADSAQASVGLVGVLIELQKLINGSYVTIQQGMTGDSGESFIQTDASESYLFIFSKSGFVSATAQSIPNILDYSVTLSLVSQVFTYIDDISFSFTPIETILDYNQSINFTGFISGTSFSFTQFNIYNSTNDLIYQQNSTNPTGTNFIKQINISNTTTEITTEIVYIVNGITKTTSKTYTIKTITGFIKTAQDYSEDETFTAKFIRFLVIMILVVSSLAITRTESIQEISLFVVPVYVFLSYINFIPWTQAAALSMLAIIFFIGGKR